MCTNIFDGEDVYELAVSVIKSNSCWSGRDMYEHGKDMYEQEQTTCVKLNSYIVAAF